MPDILRILVADDDEDDQFFFQESISHFKNLGYNITSVYHGRQLMDCLLKRGAYKKDKTPLPDIIILDLNMPFEDGFSALRQIKGNKKLRSIPVFVLSVSRNERDREVCVQLGVLGFYVKPNSGELLKGMIDEILEISTSPH